MTRAALVTAMAAAALLLVATSAAGSGKAPGVKHRPWIQGQTIVGNSLHERDDEWTGSPGSFRYRWLRCSATGNACVQVVKSIQCWNGFCIREPGGDAYEMTAQDVGHRMRVDATARNAYGSTTSISKPSRIVRK